MKNKISRILGVVLSLTLVASSLFIAAPAAAAPGDTQWFAESLPGGAIFKSGSSITGIAVANATTIYAIDAAGAAATSVYKSTNTGQSFTAITTLPAAFVGAPVAIAVAPDNADAIAVADGAALDNVYTSNDGGTTWSTMPALAGAGAATVITGLGVGPARSGTLLGREYAVSLSSVAAGVALGSSDVQIIGATAAWATAGSVVAGANLINGVLDFTSVVFSPNFLGDRTLVAVGSKAAAGSTALILINTATNTVINNPVGAVAATGTVINPTDATVGNDLGGATGILTSSIGLPSNFDPTTAAGRRAYVGIASPVGETDNDVFRIDDDTARALGASLASVASVAYAGTIDSGKLFASLRTGTNIKWTDAPTTSSPTWTSTTKAPNGTGATPRPLLKLAADFATSNRIFVGTAGTAAGENNGWFISTDGGVSFNGECFLNTVAVNNVVAVQGLELTPDGKTMFMATDDGTNLSLWKSVTPVTGTSWSRVYFTLGTAGLLAVNPEYDKSPTVFLADLVASGNIYVTSNGGATFATRMAPTGVTFAALGVQDASVVYGGSGASVYKSTNGAWSWSNAIAHKATGAVTSIVIPRYDDVLIGGTAGASYSDNGGTTFTAINTGLTGAGAIQIAPDRLYAGNKTVYAGGGTTGTILRYVIGTSTEWENLASPLAVTGIVALQELNGVLYGVHAGGAAATVDRALNPTAAAGSIDWAVDNPATVPVETGMNAGAAIATALVSATGNGTKTENILYVSNGVTALWSYKDWLAVKIPELTGLADKATVSVDPVSGRGDAITLTFKALGTGTGLVNAIDVEIREKGTGLTGVATIANTPVAGTAPSLLLTGPAGGATFFRANTDYVWALRAANTVNGEFNASKWTKARTFQVQSGSVVQQPYAGPVLTGPAGGATNVNPKLVGFSWAPVSGATEYTVIVATDAALTKPVTGTPVKLATTAYQVTGLENETTYFWAVQATKPTVGPQSIGTFTTAPKATVAPTAPATAVAQPTPIIQLPPPTTPTWAWGVIVIGAVLVIALIILILRTRRVP